MNFFYKNKRVLLPLGIFLIFLILWDQSISRFGIPSYILPGPIELANSMIDLFVSGDAIRHISITLQEVFLGIGVGIVSGMGGGYLIAKNRLAEFLTMPFFITLQTVPKISLAPLFLLWMGLGIESKVVLVALVVLFPIMINEIVAIRSIEETVYHMMYVLRAKKYQIFWHVEVPYSIEMILSGIKMAFTQAISGAVVGEMLGAKAGVGYLLMMGSENYDIALILNGVILLGMIGLTLYLLAGILEQKLLYWK